MKISCLHPKLSIFGVPLCAFIFFASNQIILAGSATWSANPPGNLWHGASNWTPMTVPNGPNDTATFQTSSQPNIPISANTEVNGITFSGGANNFTFTNAAGTTLTISGSGMNNGSPTIQAFIILGHLAFINAANAGTLANISTGNNASITFSNTASAGSATFVNYSGSTMSFLDSSTASNASFMHTPGSSMTFSDSSAAGNATFANSYNTGMTFSNTATAGSANITLNGGPSETQNGAQASFINGSSAANAFITINGGGVNSGLGAILYFLNNSSAGASTLTTNGGVNNGRAGRTEFRDSSSAMTATLIANTASDPGRAGTIALRDNSTADMAHIQVFGNGNLDITGHAGPGVAVGTIEGDGYVLLGSKTLTVGTGDGSTTFSGHIQDTYPGGSIVKAGAGTLTLTNSNSYSGATIINNGTLRASADLALGASSIIGAYLSVGANGTLTLDSGATNNYISDFASLFLTSGSTVNLNFTGNADRLRTLFVNGVPLLPGIYGSVASGAPNQLPQLNGTGKIISTTRVVSRKIHGAAGPFDIDLPLAGPPGIECRLGGTNHDYQVVVTFFDNVAFSFVSVPTNTALVANASGNNTNTITIDLTGVANAQTTQIIVHNLNDGINMTDLYIPMGVLVADVNSNRVVNASDIAQVKSQSGQPVTDANFRADINCNGVINASDVIQPKLMSGTFLP